MSFFSEIEKNPKIHIKPQKSLSSQRNLEKRKQNKTPKASHLLISKYITKPQYTKQYVFGIKTDTDIIGRK